MIGKDFRRHQRRRHRSVWLCSLRTYEHHRPRRDCRLLPFREGGCGCLEDARFQRQPRELRDGLYAQFRRDRRAVQLHRPLVDAEVTGNLLIEPTLYDVEEYFELSLAERVET